METQTVYQVDLEIHYKECLFEVSCEDELRWHMNSEHNWDEPGYENKFTCDVCAKQFSNKSELMIHRKEKHPNKTKMCRYFEQGNCAFDGSICWFSHDQTNEGRGSSFSQTLKEFRCIFCDQIFKNK